MGKAKSSRKSTRTTRRPARFDSIQDPPSSPEEVIPPPNRRAANRRQNSGTDDSHASISSIVQAEVAAALTALRTQELVGNLTRVNRDVNSPPNAIEPAVDLTTISDRTAMLSTSSIVAAPIRNEPTSVNQHSTANPVCQQSTSAVIDLTRQLSDIPDVRSQHTVGGVVHNQGNMAAPCQRQHGGLLNTTMAAIHSPTAVTAIIPPASLHLPYVQPSLLSSLADQGKFIELADLHPDTLKPSSAQATKTHIAFDPDQPGIATFTTHVKRKNIDSYELWSQCFATFQAYRSYYFPNQAIELANYYRFIATKAEVYKPEAWVGYDKAFRCNAALYPGQTNWSLPDPQLDFIHFQQHPHLIIPRCFACGKKGHMAADCQRNVTESNNPYVWHNNNNNNNNKQRANYGPSANPNSTQICRAFNRGQCNDPCQNGRIHRWLSSHHKRSGKQSYPPHPFRGNGGAGQRNQNTIPNNTTYPS